MSLPIDTECMLCQLKRYVTRARTLGDEETAVRFMKALMQLHSNAPAGVSSPSMNPGTAALFREFYGLGEDQYKEEKAMTNQFVMANFEKIESMALSAPDPVFAALQLAVLGNYLDFGALQGSVDTSELERMLLSARDMPLDKAAYAALCADLSSAKRLLYLTDNAGEIGFDRILAQEIHKKYPQVEITFCVRGGYTLNDATREDAAYVGVPFPVIDNGNAVGGTELSLLSQAAKQALEAADVIISKGMGNVETLWGCGYNIYYAFLVKCNRFVREFGKPLMTPMLLKEIQ